MFKMKDITVAINMPQTKHPRMGRVTMIIARDSDDRKFNCIPEYGRVQNWKNIHMAAHV